MKRISIVSKMLLNRKELLLAALLFTALWAVGIGRASAQTQLSKYLPGATPEGAVYFLPKTALRISVQVEKTTFEPGDFCRYAQKYLRLSDAGQEAWTQHRVLDISQTAMAVADTAKRYALKFNPKTAAVNVRLSDDGCLLGINVPVEQKPLTSLEEHKQNTANEAPATETASEAASKPSSKETAGWQSARRYLTEEILAAGSAAKMAELTAAEIYDVRENRSLLVKGQADFMPKDGRQLELMLQELDQQDRALTALFAGTTIRDTTVYIIDVVPDSATTERQLLFRLSQALGVVDTDDLSGEPFYITIENMNVLPPIDEEATAKAKKPKVYEAGVYVNVPGRMRATIYQGIEQLQTAVHPAPQFGYTQLLSGVLFNNRFTTRLWLNKLTGAVERLDAEQPK